MAAWLVENLIGDPKFAAVARVTCAKSLGEYNGWNIKKNEYNDRFYQKVCFKASLG